jgi:NDP-sugar pyrophosphorylase family protein
MSEARDRPVEAVILAGGIGTRLRPYSHIIPKPLVPIHGIPVIEIVLRQLARYDFRKVAITLGYQADLIKAHIADGSRFGLDVSYNLEEKPLGTAAPVANVENLAENFLVLNGDLITTLDYRNLFAYHLESGGSLTIAAHERFVPVEFGVIQGEDGYVSGYVEKPNLQYRVSMGIYTFNRDVLQYIKRGERLDFPNLVLTMLNDGEPVRFYPFEGYWLDIGSGADFERAVDQFPSMRKELLGED